MRYRMYTGKLGNFLSMSHIEPRAWIVRSKIARDLFDGDQKRMRLAGWRVVRVTVQEDSPVVI